MKTTFASLSLIFFLAQSPTALGETSPIQIFSKESAPTSQIEISDSNGSRTSAKIKYQIYAPPNYPHCPDPNPCFGVVYFLHGRHSNEKMLEDLGIREAFEQLQKQQQQIPFIIVAPAGGNNYWMNAANQSQGKANWSDFIAQDLIEEVESQNPQVIRDSRHRILAGISMGGHGALQIAMNHPNKFNFIAGHSPVLRSYKETDEFRPQFGELPEYKLRDPLSLLAQKNLQKQFLKIEGLWIDMGNQDWAIQRTQKFSEELHRVFASSEIDLRIDFSQSEGHEMSYWTKRLPEYLTWYAEKLAPHRTPQSKKQSRGLKKRKVRL